MRDSSMISGFLALIISWPVLADLQVTESGGSQTYISGTQVKMVSDDMVFISDLKSKTVTMAHHRLKLVWSGSAKEFCAGQRELENKINSQVESVMDTMLNNYSEEQRAAMLAIMQEDQDQGPSEVVVSSLGRSEMIAGYPTTKYEVIVDGEPSEMVWVTYEKGIMAQMKSLSSFSESVECLELMKEPEDFPAYSVIHDGYIMKRVDLEGDEETTVTSLAIKAVSASEFEIPVGYQSKKLKAFYSANIGYLSNELHIDILRENSP